MSDTNDENLAKQVNMEEMTGKHRHYRNKFWRGY
jgi:hypothetical protein